MDPRETDEQLTYVELLFWERVFAASLADPVVDGKIAAAVADDAVTLRRKRAARVVDYYGDGLYLKDGRPSRDIDTCARPPR